MSGARARYLLELLHRDGKDLVERDGELVIVPPDAAVEDYMRSSIDECRDDLLQAIRAAEAVKRAMKGGSTMDRDPMFADLDAWNRDNPGYFDLPPLQVRDSISVGCFAQVATAGSAHHWLWIEVLERTPFGYRGLVRCAPPDGARCPHRIGDAVDFAACHVHDVWALRAVGPSPTYEQVLADAQKLGRDSDWKRVTAWEDAEIAKRVPESMRGSAGAERLAAYLTRCPHCAPCAAEGLTIDATTAFYVTDHKGGDADENLMPMCRASAYVFVARANGWQVRGCDINGIPYDPDHPWNRDR